MGGGRTRGVSARLEGVRRRFERWRQTRKGHSRIPDALWAAAVRVAATQGISRTAATLRVDYYALKKRVETTAAAASSTPEENRVAAFLELAPPASIGFGECTVEWEGAAGAKMRMHWKGFAAPDLATLSRSFWKPEL
ncbi:MAG: hypothetical protein ACYC35_04435 [Pirellulales bacterium]